MSILQWQVDYDEFGWYYWWVYIIFKPDLGQKFDSRLFFIVCISLPILEQKGFMRRNNLKEKKVLYIQHSKQVFAD